MELLRRKAIGLGGPAPARPVRADGRGRAEGGPLRRRAGDPAGRPGAAGPAVRDDADGGDGSAQRLDRRVPSGDKEGGAFSARRLREPRVREDELPGQPGRPLDPRARYGHALHSPGSRWRTSPYHSSRYVPFLAEIASTCNEALLTDYLAARAADPQERAGLPVDELEGVRTKIYRQTLSRVRAQGAQLRRGRHTPVTASLLDETHRELVRRYYPGGLHPGRGRRHGWAYIPHLYYKYYVYGYATGRATASPSPRNVRRAAEPRSTATWRCSRAVAAGRRWRC
ncbi:MAG: hypothetical protein IPI34_09505 [bacterium]|nr:hypothetical protein [bacterium]